MKPKTKNPLTVAALALALGVSRSTIYEWRRHGAPEANDLDQWREWVGRYRANLQSASPEMARLKRRLLKAKVARAEHELSEMKERLVPLVDVHRVWGQERRRIESILLPFASEVAPLVVNQSIPDAARILKERIYETLYILAGDKPATNPSDPTTKNDARMTGENQNPNTEVSHEPKNTSSITDRSESRD